MRSRHGRELRADNDPRRRPADGFRTRDARRFLQLADEALTGLPEELADLAHQAELVVADVAVSDNDGPTLARYEAVDESGFPRLTLYRRSLEARAATHTDLVDVIRVAAGRELAAATGLDFNDPDAEG